MTLPDTRQGMRPTPPGWAVRADLTATPTGWHRSPGSDGREQWTWAADGIPLVSVLAGPEGMSPPMVRDPYHYWLMPEVMERCALALAQLAAFVARRGA